MGRTVPAFVGYSQAAQEELKKTMQLALRRMITKYPKLASTQMEESLKSESESEEDEGGKIQLQEVEGAEQTSRGMKERSDPTEREQC